MFNLTPKEKKLVVLLGILLAVGLIFRFVIPEKDTFVSQSAGRAQGAGQEETFAGGGSSVQENSGDFFTPEEEKLIVVHITGAVNNPGVYTLTEGSRVFHVVEKAGGQAEDADLEGVNLAQPLYDGQPVFIPRRGDRDFLAPAGGASTVGNLTAAKVNINMADQAQLETLPGIGGVKAQNIINYRQENGPFKSPEDLINVNGIGKKTLEGMKDLITVY
ncbi:MAG: helix-hairpin-helix domain-containing protein [Dethiobacteria bacterium]